MIKDKEKKEINNKSKNYNEKKGRCRSVDARQHSQDHITTIRIQVEETLRIGNSDIDTTNKRTVHQHNQQARCSSTHRPHIITSMLPVTRRKMAQIK
jgi:hypothetical protein